MQGASGPAQGVGGPAQGASGQAQAVGGPARGGGFLNSVKQLIFGSEEEKE